jgi:hypothetical protein
VFVVSFNDGIAVFNLDDSHKNALYMTVAGHGMRLAPGSHVLITGEHVRSINDNRC